MKNEEMALLFSEATPYIQKYHGKTLVIKYGGNAMVSEELKQQVMEDVVLLSLIGVKVVLVHGGGPEISGMLKKLGKQSEFIDGLRVTDRETADVVQMVLAGKINKTLVNLLEMMGGKAMGLCGLDGRMIRASMRDARLGYVGKVESVDVQPILDLLEHGYIPVISTIGSDTEGNVYNINADTVAAGIAGALGAERLIEMTDIAGILRDTHDPGSLIPRLSVSDAVQLFREGVISGGMIPKVECCIEAVLSGVKTVIIMDGRIPHAILIELLTDEGAGTMVTGDDYHDDETA